MAFNVSTRLTSILSSNSFVVISLPKASATVAGFGINPDEVVCHINKVTAACITIIIMKVCLLMIPNGLNIFFILVPG
jgi:hypothetical protein